MQFVLVLYIIGGGTAMTTLPDKFMTEGKCNAAGAAWSMARPLGRQVGYYCIPVDLRADPG